MTVSLFCEKCTQKMGEFINVHTSATESAAAKILGDWWFICNECLLENRAETMQ